MRSHTILTFGISTRFARQLAFSCLKAWQHASRVTAPVLVMTGLDDQFVVPRVARALARKYNATLREYRSFAHHIMSEPGWEGPCGDVSDWLDRVAHA